MGIISGEDKHDTLFGLFKKKKLMIKKSWSGLMTGESECVGGRMLKRETKKITAS